MILEDGEYQVNESEEGYTEITYEGDRDKETEDQMLCQTALAYLGSYVLENQSTPEVVCSTIKGKSNEDDGGITNS